MYKNVSMKIFITLLTLLLLTSSTSFAHCGGYATDMKQDHASEKHHHDDHIRKNNGHCGRYHAFVIFN